MPIASAASTGRSISTTLVLSLNGPERRTCTDRAISLRFAGVTTGPARALLRRLGQFLDPFSACFSRRPQRDAATQYIDGLFNDSERKSMQAMHGRLSDPGSYQALQHFITHSPWDAARVWTQLRAQVPARTGILALDDTGFPKQGRTRSACSGSTAARSARSAIVRSRCRRALLADGRPGR